MDEPQRVEPLLLCPNCLSEMRLFGTEPESDTRDIYTFQCDNCRPCRKAGRFGQVAEHGLANGRQLPNTSAMILNDAPCKFSDVRFVPIADICILGAGWEARGYVTFTL
jgi:hypothetical protein